MAAPALDVRALTKRYDVNPETKRLNIEAGDPGEGHSGEDVC